MKKQALFFLILIIMVNVLNAQDDPSTTYEPLYDLSSEWYYNTNEGFMPYIKENGEFTRSIAFKINPDRYPDNYLRLHAPYPGAVFFDGKLVYNGVDAIHINLNCDSLSLYYKENLHISIYIPTGVDKRLTTNISAKNIALESARPDFGAMPRETTDNSHYYLIILLLAFTLLILINSERRTYDEFFSLSQISMGRVRDDSIYKLKLFDWPISGFYLFHGTLLAFLLLSFDRYNQIGYDLDIMEGLPVLIRWIVVSLLIFVVFVVKFLLIKNLGVLFDLKSSANYYFFEFMRMSMVFFGVLAVLTAIIFIKWPNWLYSYSDISLNVVFIFMAIRFIILFIRVGKLTPFKNLHLFSYLCTTEILPIVVGIHYFYYGS